CSCQDGLMDFAVHFFRRTAITPSYVFMKRIYPTHVSSPARNRQRYLRHVLVIAMLVTAFSRVVAQSPNTWTQKADMAGLGRYAAVGFSIGNKGYSGTGFD